MSGSCGDLLPKNWVMRQESSPSRRTCDEATVQRGADHRDPARAGGGRSGQGDHRRHGISEQSFYRWKAKYGGMEVSEARRLRALEAENGKLKRLLAEAHLDNAALKDVLGRKW